MQKQGVIGTRKQKKDCIQQPTVFWRCCFDAFERNEEQQQQNNTTTNEHPAPRRDGPEFAVLAAFFFFLPTSASRRPTPSQLWARPPPGPEWALDRRVEDRPTRCRLTGGGRLDGPRPLGYCRRRRPIEPSRGRGCECKSELPRRREGCCNGRASASLLGCFWLVASRAWLGMPSNQIGRRGALAALERRSIPLSLIDGVFFLVFQLPPAHNPHGAAGRGLEIERA